MSLLITIPDGEAATAIPKLFEKEGLSRYFPLTKSVPDPVSRHAEIPYFGHVSKEVRTLGNGKDDDFYMLGRKSKWSMALVLTKHNLVVLNIQPKPGLNAASLEFPGGGIPAGPTGTKEEIIRLTAEQALKESGFQGDDASYLGFTIIETGKMYDPDAKEPFVPGVGRGLKAHCVVIRKASRIKQQELAPTESIQTVLVTVPDLKELVRRNILTEASSLACFTLALMSGHLN